MMLVWLDADAIWPVCSASMWQGPSILRDCIIWMQFCFYKSFWFAISTFQGSKNKLLHRNQRSIWLRSMFLWYEQGFSLLRDCIVWMQFCLYKSFCSDISTCQGNENKLFHCNQRSMCLGWTFLWLGARILSSARFHCMDAVLFVQVVLVWY